MIIEWYLFVSHITHIDSHGKFFCVQYTYMYTMYTYMYFNTMVRLEIWK